MWVSQPRGRGGGVKPVGTKSQVWQRMYFFGSPKPAPAQTTVNVGSSLSDLIMLPNCLFSTAVPNCSGVKLYSFHCGARLSVFHCGAKLS